ncbi:MAG TPA: GGDEF domain-containing protein [Clostridia bacterium]|nr:GGDEF domain-containing protein [Clostridia bacterium]
MMSEWHEALSRCAEGLYVLEEESKRIVWVNSYFVETLGTSCVGEYCWKAFLDRETPCPFCPQLTEKDDVYVWEYFDSRSKRWMKVKHLVFLKNSVLYRAGNINTMDDVMRLNYETVQEIVLLQSILTENRNEMASLTREAIYDTLTGLFNRNCFQLDLEQEYAKVSGLGVLYFDLNNLKETNDKYRHTAGDMLLRRMASVLQRTAGHFKNAKCYRIGGDEFVLFLAHCTEEELTRCATLFNSYLTAYNDGEKYVCSAAMGRAYSKIACNPEVLVTQADRDMYRCKKLMESTRNY